MPIDLSGIQNVGEFYSHHYLDALLEGDLKGLFARWRRDYKDGNRGAAAADDANLATPDRRLDRCAADFFRAKRDALRERQPERRYPPSHSIHVALLEALGYPYDFNTRYLADGSAVPVLGAVQRDARRRRPAGPRRPLPQRGRTPARHPRREQPQARLWRL